MDWDSLTPIQKVQHALDAKAGDDFYVVDDAKGDEITLMINDEVFTITLKGA
jgi:hypothetical protein